MRKPVIGWEGTYEVTSDGRIFSLARTVKRSDGTLQTWPERELSPFEHSTGYWVVRLSRPNVRKMARLHRLVAEAFLENPDALPEVNHIDGNRKNAKVTNLEWCTPSQNRYHAFHVLKSITMPNAGCLNFEIAQAIRAEHIPGKHGCRRIARKYGVDPSTVSAILANRTYPLPPPPEAA